MLRSRRCWGVWLRRLSHGASHSRHNLKSASTAWLQIIVLSYSRLRRMAGHGCPSELSIVAKKRIQLSQQVKAMITMTMLAVLCTYSSLLCVIRDGPLTSLLLDEWDVLRCVACAVSPCKLLQVHQHFRAKCQANSRTQCTPD